MLATEYRLTREELSMVKNFSREIDFQLSYAVLLMVFKDLNYFPPSTSIPEEIIDCLKEQLQIPKAKFNLLNASTVSRYKQSVYNYFKITCWKKVKKEILETLVNPARKFVIKTSLEASETLNYPADIINVVIEQLKKNNFELPSFKQLDRLVRYARKKVNQKIFDTVYHSLEKSQIELLDKLLETTPDYMRSGYNEIKAPSKNPTISHFRDLLKHHNWLVSSFDDISNHLKDITPIKLKQFAQQARSLDASDLKDFVEPKRYTLMLSLIHQVQAKTKDALALMFCKTIIKMHKKAKEKLETLQESFRERTQELLGVFSDILGDFQEKIPTLGSLHKIKGKIEDQGGAEILQSDCEQAIAFNSNNHLPLLKDYYNKDKRSILLRLLKTLDLHSSTQQDALIKAMKYVLENSSLKAEHVSKKIDLSFTTKLWRKLIVKKEKGEKVLNRKYLELCVLSHVANDLRSGDLFVVDADFYADYRKELLPWSVCKKMIGEYCEKVKIASNGYDCVKELKDKLTRKAQKVDDLYPELEELIIDKSENPILKKREPKKKPSSAVWLEKTIKSRMPERNLIDILCSSHFYCGWAHEFGLISGDEAKVYQVMDRYILTNFAFATGMGPTQTAQHVRGSISAHIISWINKRHITPEMLDRARKKLIDLINQFEVIKSWGEGKAVIGDGTLYELREQNIITEFHMRHKKKGGMAYHHVADNYILLFSTFMPCGVWEAVEIIEGLLKNDSDVQPDIIHGDTQSQSTIVFALAYLLGFRLMPRIRNWKDIKFFKPDKKTIYKHIEVLFSDPINWDLIELHCIGKT